MTTPEPSRECRVVELEWDRGHEVFEAIVRAETEAGIIVTRLNDYTPLFGLTWIRADELLDVSDLDEDEPSVRLANLRGTRLHHLDPSWTDLTVLLTVLEKTAPLVMVHRRRTGSDSGRVGRITSVLPERVCLDEVDPRGRLTGDVLEVELDDIIAVQWDNDYLAALRDLVDHGQANTERG